MNPDAGSGFSTCGTLLSLVGHQPEAVVLPTLKLKPAKAILLHTDTTQKVAGNARRVLEGGGIAIQLQPCESYVFTSAEKAIDGLAKSENSLCLNITSGTKPMLLGAYRAAESCRLPFCYLESEGGTQVLHSYHWDVNGKLACSKEPIDVQPTIEQFLACYGVHKLNLGTTKSSYEREVAAAVGECVDEKCSNVMVAANVEIDMIARCGSRFGFVEAFEGKAKPKHKIDQLVQATEKHRFGTFTKRILVVRNSLDENNAALAKVAGIDVIVWSPGDGHMDDEFSRILGAPCGRRSPGAQDKEASPCQ